MFPAKVPIDSIYYKDSDDSKNRCLLVLLPGRGGSAKDFEEEGFIREVRKEGLNIDMVAVEAHLGYYANRSIVTRLKEDVIEPAKSAGYEQIWLAGISMGALGALYYTKAYPEDIYGLILLAPYLGEQEVINEISNAGGVQKWNPSKVDKDDWQREQWKWIKAYTSRQENAAHFYLGYGVDDRYASTHKLLAELLPKQNVLSGKGGHDWATWRPIWAELLEKAGFPL